MQRGRRKDVRVSAPDVDALEHAGPVSETRRLDVVMKSVRGSHDGPGDPLSACPSFLKRIYGRFAVEVDHVEGDTGS
jgi:hypothetical protein